MAFFRTSYNVSNVSRLSRLAITAYSISCQTIKSYVNKRSFRFLRTLSKSGVCLRCFYHLPHVFLLALIFSPVTAAQTGTASFYGFEACQFNPSPKCETASGRSLYQLEKEGLPYAATWDMPFGTRVRVTNLSNGASTVVQIMDRGPSRRLADRIIDLNKKSFAEIEDPSRGLARVRVEVVR